MRCVLGTRPPVMHTEYCDCVFVALRARYCDCCAVSLWHQVFLLLCIVHCVPGIKSVVYWVLGLTNKTEYNWGCCRRFTASDVKCSYSTELVRCYTVQEVATFIYAVVMASTWLRKGWSHHAFFCMYTINFGQTVNEWIAAQSNTQAAKWWVQNFDCMQGRDCSI